MYFGVYCLTIIPLVLSGGLVLNDVSKITNCSDCIKFPSENSNYSFSLFSVISKKEYTPTVLVGARGFVLQISMDGMLINHILIPVTRKDTDRCHQKECNYIVDTIIPQKTGLILACARNIYAKCWMANETSIIGKALTKPFYILKKKKFVISEPYMFESYLESENRGILRKVDMDMPDEPILKAQLDYQGIKFVGVYEFGDFIYYFFTDLSEEILGVKAGSRVTYARVGRMCKYDKGGKRLNRARDYITTFSKARLVCSSTTSEETFEYNHLEITSFTPGDDGNGYVYGLFRASKPAGDMFAVCRYSISEIDNVLEDKKYYEIDKNSVKVVNVPNDDPRRLKCKPSINTRGVVWDRILQVYRKRRTHVETVSPDGGQPVLVHRHPKISHMFADFVTIAKKSYDVVRYFDSSLMYELFVPVQFFQGAEEETYLLTRQISEDPMDITDVTKIKYTGVSPEIPAPSSSLFPLSTSSVTKTTLNVLSTAKPSPKQSPSVSPSLVPTSGSPNTNIPSVNNSSNSSNDTMLGNVSASLGKSSLSHVTTPNLLSTNSLSAMPRVLATPTPSRTTSYMSSYVSAPGPWASFVDQEKIIIAAEKKLVFVPVASCGVYTSCRECIAARNPYCGWHDGSCVQLGATENRSYIQDKGGDYSKVCPRVDVTCDLVVVGKLIPKVGVTLKCLPSGVPTPRVLKWSKNDTTLSTNQENIIDEEEQTLTIRRYSLKAAGNYTCHVNNGGTPSSCSVEILGSSPQIKCKVTKLQKKFWLACNATGFPQPKLDLEPGERRQAGRARVLIERGHKYHFIAYNAFGAESGGIYEIISKSLEFEIKDVEWSDELKNPRSSQFKDLESKVLKGVQQVYKDNDLFQDITNVTFRKGSVVAKVELTGLNTPSPDESELTRELQNAINTGNLGDLKISEYDGKPDVPDQQSTSSAPPTTRPLETTDSSVPAVVAQSSESSGVPVWLLFLLLIIIGLIVFVVGYCCGLKDICFILLYKLFGRTRACSKDHDDTEEGEEDEGKSMSRSEKARESQRNLLGKHKAKKQKSPVKRTNHEAHELTNNVSSKEGSIEIKHNGNSAEDLRPQSGHSTC